jgi:colicin import membrane protein
VSGFLWVLAIIVLNAAVAAIAKKAQENRAMQAKGGATPPKPSTPAPTPAPTASPTPARQVVRAPKAAGVPAAPRAVVVPPPVPVQTRSESPLSRAEVEAQHRARMQAKAQAESQARARAQAKAKAQAQAEVQARARAQVQAQARQTVHPAAKPAGSALQRAAARAGGEELAALHSRERVSESLAKVQAAERKVADALPGHAHAGAQARPTQSVAQNLRALLRDRSRVREAFILSEVLGPSKGNLAPSAGPLGGR